MRVALERSRRQAGAIVQGGVPGRVGRGGVGRVPPRQHAEQQRGIGDRARDGACRVLAVRDRQDALPADQAHGGLQADHPIDRRRAQDAAVGLGAHADGRQVGGYRHRAARAGAAGIAVQCIGVAGLSAASAPARGRMRRTEIGPLAQVGLAEDHRAGLAQAPHQERVPAGPEILQRQRARGSGHGYGVDVVLQQYRDAVQRAAHRIGAAFHVAQRRFLQRVRVEFDDGVELGPGLVDRSDAVQVSLCQPPAVQFSRLHARLQVGDVEFGIDEVGRGCGRGGIRRRCRLAGCQGEHQAERQQGSTHVDTFVTSVCRLRSPRTARQIDRRRRISRHSTHTITRLTTSRAQVCQPGWWYSAYTSRGR